MATERAAFAGDGVESVDGRLVPRVDNQVERPMQGHGAEVTGVEGDQGAGRVTAPAIDALGLAIERLAGGAVNGDGKEIVRVQVVAGHEPGEGSLIDLEERFEIDRQVANDRQVAQRLDAKVVADIPDQGAAGELLAAIDDHAAGTAHADAAGKTECQVRAGAALQGKEAVQDAGLLRNFNGMRLEPWCVARAGTGAPDADRDFRHRRIMGSGNARCKWFSFPM